MLKLLKKTVLRNMNLWNGTVVVFIHVAGDTDQEGPSWAYVNAESYSDIVSLVRKDESINAAALRVVETMGVSAINRCYSFVPDPTPKRRNLMAFDYSRDEIPNFNQLIEEGKLVLLHDRGCVVDDAPAALLDEIAVFNYERERSMKTFARA